MEVNRNITVVACYFGPKLGVGVFTEKLLTHLCPLLLENGYNVSLITNNNVLNNSPQINIDGVDIVCPAELDKTIPSKMYFLRKFAKTVYVKDAKYVLFLADSVIGAGITNAVSIVHDINEFDIENKFGLIRTWFRKKMIGSVIERAYKIVTISEFVKDQIVKYFPCKQFEGRLSVIHNGIDFAELSAIEISGDNSAPYFLIVGRIDPKGKKLYEALKIYKAYKAKNPEFRLKIAGAVNEFCEKEATVFLSTIEKMDGIEYLGYVSDENLDGLYRNAFATIFYSEFEGFGFPLLEAFYRGCPVITNSDNQVNNELAEGYDVKISPQDLDNQEMICWKIDMIRQMDREALKLIAGHYTWSKTARAYFNLLNE